MVSHKPSPKALSSSIRHALGPSAQKPRHRGLPDHALYEIYLFMLCVRAAGRAGYNVDYLETDMSGFTSNVSGPFNLRSSQSRFVPRGGQKYAHALLTNSSSKRLEIHLDVPVEGGSGMNHEGDVVILQHKEGERARARKREPKAKGVVAFVEAKFRPFSPSLEVGRAIVGVATDLRPRSGNYNFRRSYLVTIADEVTASGAKTPISNLGKRNKVHMHFDAVPGSQSVQLFESKIEGLLRDFI